MARSVAQKLAAIDGRGPRSKKGRSTAAKLAAIDEFFNRTGLLGEDGGGLKPDGGGPSIGGGLKKVGLGALKALSVPQAAVFTAAAKATGYGDNISWKNALGDFYTSKSGESGVDAALGALGIESRMGRLVTSIIADPLWLVGAAIVRAPSKAAAIAKAASQGERRATDAVQLTSGRGARAAIGPGRQRAAIGPGRQAGKRYADAVQKEAARRMAAGRSPTVGVFKLPGETQVIRNHRVRLGRGVAPGGRKIKWETRVDTPPPINKARVPGPQKGSRFGQPHEWAGSVFNIIRRPKAIGKTARVRAQRTLTGTLVAGRYFIMRANLSNKNRVYKIIDLSDPSKVTAADPVFARSFRSAKAAEEYAKKMARDQAMGMDAKKMAQFEKTGDDLVEFPDDLVSASAEEIKEAMENLERVRQLRVDDMGFITGADAAFEHLRKALAAMERVGEHSNWAIRLSFAGKGKTFVTPFRAGRRASYFRPGMLFMKPVEKVAHRLRQAGAETADGATAQILALAERFGMAERIGDQLLIKEADAAMIGVFRAARYVNAEIGERVRQILRETGRWTDQHDELTRFMDERYAYLKEADRVGGRAFEKELEPLEAELAKVQKALDKFPEESKAYNRRQKLLDRQAELERRIRLIHERGEYTPMGKRQDLLEADKARHEAEFVTGLKPKGFEFRRVRPKEEQIGPREYLDNPFAVVTPDEFVDDMMRYGVDEATARDLQQFLASELERKGLVNFKPKPGLEDVKPEWNAFLLAGRREQKHIWVQVEREIDELLKMAGLTENTAIGRLIVYGINRAQPGTITGSRPGQVALMFISHFKGFLTFVNPAHYVRNAFGDFFNSLINGNWRHLDPRAAVPRNEIWRLANAQVYAGQGRVDWEALNKIYKIGDRELTGHELLALSRMIGLGRGYVGTDVAIAVDAFQKAKTAPGEFYRWMQRMNIKRENSQRMRTWIKHMEGGDDPLVAAAKTLRVHFDYTQLTEFEKLWLRNLLLFYTWLKRNSLLQAGALFTRPGYMSAWGDLERARPKIENEPEYFSEQHAIWVPGIGNLVVGAPIQDIHKFELTWGSFRKDVLGAVTPPVRVPMELATNQKFFTGERIQDYEGQKTPHWLGYIPGLGTMTTAKAGGERAPGISPQWAHAISQFTGPQAATFQMLTHPDFEGDRMQQGLGRFTGVTPQPNRPEAFARSKRYIEAKKKADETRRRNAQR